MAPPPKVVVVIVLITLLALLGAVASQISYAPSTSPSFAAPPSLSSARSNQISYPPSQSAPTYPPTYPPSSFIDPPSPSPPSSTPPAYAPNPSQSTYSPSPSPLRQLIPPTYPPRKSPSTSISNPPTYPPSASPSPSITSPPASPKPTPSISISIPPTYSPSASPSSPISSPPTYPPSASPSPSSLIISSPASPSPSPSSSISIPPTYPPSASPILPISSPPTYPPSASLGPSPSIMSPPASPSPSPYNSISIPPTNSPSASPSPSISSPPTYPPSASPSPSNSPSGLTVGYYEYLCPNAETIVREAVKSAIDSNRGTGAGLIRLFFHDCFVQGCDASVLLNTTAAGSSGEATERASAPNLTLRGFEVIDAAKAALEKECPNVVSCADIVAFAGRDATFFLSAGGGADNNNNNTLNDFAMPAGRYDGRVSLESEALANLPPPFAGLEQLREMFAGKGLDAEDMVTLSGAHTVGRSRCSSFSDRLPPHAASDMNATLSGELVSRCRNGGDTVVAQDWVSPDGLDSQYYRNVLNHEVLFASDAALLASEQTAGMVSANAFTPGLWEAKFTAAMVKMGRVGVKSSADGEIRKKCWMVN